MILPQLSHRVLGGSPNRALVVALVASFTWQVDGLSVEFDDGSAGVVVAWSWDFGDSSSSTDASPTHVFAAPGDYLVMLTVTANGGAQASVEHTISVS